MNRTVLGFVLNVFGGRAGLFTATILPTGSSTTPITVAVSDIDGEPERFNERLLKTRLLREALTNAEPVEVVYSDSAEFGNEALEVRRIGRSHHLRAPRFEKLSGLVVGVRLFEQDIASKPEEVPDAAIVHVLDPNAGVTMLRLSMQMAERHVADGMLELIEAAYRNSTPLEFMVASADEDGDLVRPWIVSVATTAVNTTELSVDAFVESVSTSMLHNWPLALVYMRTTPSMRGVARTVDDAPFHPQPLVGVVGHGSPLFWLLDRARSEGTRVRVGLSVPRRELNEDERERLASMDELAAARRAASVGTPYTSSHDPAVIGLEPQLVVGVTVMAPLASAATPVWIRVGREALDGPPSVECRDGVPINDLSGRGVMSLQVPHRAAWVGAGCFNPGVYRIQIVAQVEPRIIVDGAPIQCVAEYAHVMPTPTPTDPATGVRESGVRESKRFLAHLCVCQSCSHELRVEFQDWRCGYELQLDVFKLF